MHLPKCLPGGGDVTYPLIGSQSQDRLKIDKTKDAKQNMQNKNNKQGRSALESLDVTLEITYKLTMIIITLCDRPLYQLELAVLNTTNCLTCKKAKTPKSTVCSQANLQGNKGSLSGLMNKSNV